MNNTWQGKVSVLTPHGVFCPWVREHQAPGGCGHPHGVSLQWDFAGRTTSSSQSLTPARNILPRLHLFVACSFQFALREQLSHLVAFPLLQYFPLPVRTACVIIKARPSSLLRPSPIYLSAFWPHVPEQICGS